jgi:tRNA(fMet)-specific endonuclease VapC
MAGVTQYLLDTNTVSHFVRGHPTVDRNIVRVPVTAIAVSSVTAGELLFGLARRPGDGRLNRTVREFLSRIDVLPWGREAAERYGIERALLERGGKTLDALDLLIAVHALTIGAVLVTSDRAFRWVRGLQIEDWTIETDRNGSRPT